MTHSKTPRISFLAISLVVMMAIFVLRLFWLQIIQHGTYSALARQSQQQQFVLPAERGKIYMMDGATPVPVVLNRVVYTMIADPVAIQPEKRSEIVRALKEIAAGEMVKDVEQRLSRQGSRYEIIARQLTRQQAEELQKRSLSGVVYRRGAVRSYPEGQLAAQVLGFVNHDGQGQYGVEQGLNQRLKGRDGLLRAVTDVRNVPLTVGKENMRIEPRQGEHIVLSLDRNVQHYAEEVLLRGIKKAGATEGSILVMNPTNGRVLAMANYPTFRPAEYFTVQQAGVFVNPITTLAYEPGSVIKTFTMATGIDKGVISPQSVYQNADCTRVGDRTICNALRGHGGPTTMQQALANSYNVGTVTVGRLLGNGSQLNAQARQILYEYFHDKFGFGQLTGIEVAEQAGILHAPHTEQGNEVRYANMTFGQGMNITTIQVAAAFCSLVNGGQYFAPTLVAGVADSAGTPVFDEAKPRRRTIQPETSTQMRQMLEVARRSSWLGKSDMPGYRIGGKTGTAETVQGGSYTTDETVGTYIGFGGADQPEYVIMVRVAAPGKGINLQGDVHAGPIFTELSNWMLQYLTIAPRR